MPGFVTLVDIDGTSSSFFFGQEPPVTRRQRAFFAHYSVRQALGSYSSYSGQLVDGVHGNAAFNAARGSDLAGIFRQMAE